ncbi:FKBP-type peptidyl-prolyl cis-trans isomerase [Mesorhizobium xinjiangense]|uniref:FKBP-type peptidyl-prolyl cis-trans isomerase n=1 Tax=Mesorhizobium xinjiangense TaxID=2678685 RepID=UPI0012ED5037|nr:peptidylprolyl isomerase [Mesorhizobium xinjiangense]
MAEVKSGDTVRIHYTGKLADGTEFDSSAGREPLEFQVGAGQIIPGLDRQIDGMSVGDKQTLTIPADEAYGQRDDARVQTLPRSTVPPDIELAVGARLQATTSEGGTVTLLVTDLNDDEVTVDANHPLAGENLVFDVEIVEIVGG